MQRANECLPVVRCTDAYVKFSFGRDCNLSLCNNRWELSEMRETRSRSEGWHGEYGTTFTLLKQQHFSLNSRFVCLFHLKTANIMPKANSTESTATNFQDIVLVNSSNTNLDSRMGDLAGENNVKKKVEIDDECDAIGDLIGHYGKWQFVMTILLSLFQVPNTFHIFSPTFQVIWSIFLFLFGVFFLRKRSCYALRFLCSLKKQHIYKYLV